MTLALTLAPSEVVVLHADRFVPAAGRFTPTIASLADPDASLSLYPFAEAVVRAAVLGLERDGFLTLEHTRPRAMLGLMKRHAVVAALGNADGEPERVVERGLLGALREMEGTPEVDGVVQVWLAEDRADPRLDVITDVVSDL